MSKQLAAIEIFSNILAGRLCLETLTTTEIQQDPSTHSILVKITADNRSGYVWVKTNGAINTESGKRVLLSGSRIPKKCSLKLSDILTTTL